MNYGKVEERSSSRSRSPSTERRAATSAILTDILSRSDRPPTPPTVDAWPGKSILTVPGELSPYPSWLLTGKQDAGFVRKTLKEFPGPIHDPPVRPVLPEAAENPASGFLMGYVFACPQVLPRPLSPQF